MRNAADSRLNSVPVVPAPVGREVDVWRAAGSPYQERIGWPRQRWIDQFSPHVARFALLPDHLGRPVVRQACLRSADSPADSERSFLTFMARGYGRVGYGPFPGPACARRDAGCQRSSAGRRQPGGRQPAGGGLCMFGRSRCVAAARPRTRVRHQVPVLLRCRPRSSGLMAPPPGPGGVLRGSAG